MTETATPQIDRPRRKQGLVKRMLPKSLLGRTLLIIVSPLILLQVVTGFVFYENHWDKVSRRLALSVAGDVSTVSAMLRRMPEAESFAWIRNIALHRMEMQVEMRVGEILPNQPPLLSFDRADRFLVESLAERLDKPFIVDTTSLDKDIVVQVQHGDGVLRITTTRKRLSSSTTYVFVIWMAGTSMILFGVATLFMRNQIRPIRRLARAADAFGKGRDMPHFKPEGASEVRLAASAFIDMRERIKRHVGERTGMLAGVSHDLRTPLTRMRLQLALLGDSDGVDELTEDVAEMERMLDGYLAFARGEGGEQPVQSDLAALLDDIVGRARRKGGSIDLHTEGALTISIKPVAFERCLTNMIENAVRHGDHVSVRAGRRDDAIEVTIDDDGPGIPAEERENVFRPFYRLDTSRNPETGGVGLGMPIARDIVRGHGGDIVLGDSPSGGLRVRIRLPL